MIAVIGNWASARSSFSTAQDTAEDLPKSRTIISSISGDGRTILLEVTRKESSFLYRVSLVDGKATRLTTASIGYEGDSSFSPDGKRIAFTYRAEDRAPSRIMVIDKEGGTPRVLIQSSGSDFRPHFDHNGERIYFARSSPNGERGWDLYQADAHGKNVTQLTKQSFNHDFEYYLIALEAISPDGRQALLKTHSELGVRLVLLSLSEPDTQPLALQPRIPNQPSHPQLTSATFSPDGQSVLFLAATQGPDVFDYDVYRTNVVSGETEKLTSHNGHASDLQVATAANTAVFLKWDLKTSKRVLKVPNSSHVYMLDLETKKARPIPVTGISD